MGMGMGNAAHARRLGDDAVEALLDDDWNRLYDIAGREAENLNSRLSMGCIRMPRILRDEPKPLAVAVFLRLPTVFRELTTMMADFHIRDRANRRVTHFLAASGSITFIQTIRQSVPDMFWRARDKHGWTPLDYAAAHGHLQYVQYAWLNDLIHESTLRVHVWNGPIFGRELAVNCNRAVALASAAGHSEVVRFLIEQMNVPLPPRAGNRGVGMAHLAAWHGDPDLVCSMPETELLRRGSWPTGVLPDNEHSAFVVAAAHAEDQQLSEILSRKWDAFRISGDLTAVVRLACFRRLRRRSRSWRASGQSSWRRCGACCSSHSRSAPWTS
jgi:hypothetical protein